MSLFIYIYIYIYLQRHMYTHIDIGTESAAAQDAAAPQALAS